MYVLMKNTYIQSWRIHTYGLNNMILDTYVLRRYDLKNTMHQRGWMATDEHWWMEGIERTKPNGQTLTNIGRKLIDIGRKLTNVGRKLMDVERNCGMLDGIVTNDNEWWRWRNYDGWWGMAITTNGGWWLQRMTDDDCDKWQRWRCYKTICVYEFCNDGVQKRKDFFFFLLFHFKKKFSFSLLQRILQVDPLTFV